MGSREIDMEEQPQGNSQEQRELEEGPPPGFQCMPSQHQQLQEQEKMEQDENNHNIGDTDVDDDDDDEAKGPPPGFSTPPALPSDVDMGPKESDTDEDDGPPPGWHSVSPPRVPSETPSTTTASSDIEMGKRGKGIKGKSRIPPLGSQSSSMQESLSSPSPPVPPPPSAAAVSSETGSKQGDARGDNQGPKFKRQSVSPSQSLPPKQLPQPPPRGGPLSSDMGQMVCGSCRQLLSYPRGAKYVQCSPCQTVNLVLEAHQVGQVKCGGCSVLLMYPFGSPAVRCSSCRFVTDIGAHNNRPPLSEQQARRRQPSGRAH